MLVLTKRAIRYARLTVTAARRTRRAQRSTRGRPDPPPDDHYVTVARVRHDDADHDDSLTRAVARVDARDVLPLPPPPPAPPSPPPPLPPPPR